MDRWKFRVWYNGDYSLSAFCQIDINGNVWMADTDGANECDFINITDKCTVEMSTGLRDKNGNLIYESDIVKLDSGAIYKIIWRYNGFRYCGIKDPQNQRTLYYDDFDFTKVSEIPALKCEIIDNVHTEEQK